MIDAKSQLLLILTGGKIVFSPRSDDPQQRTSLPIYFERYGLSFLILGLTIWLLIPFLAIPSSIGSIEYKYPDEFVRLNSIEKYFTLLFYNLLIALGSLTSIEPISGISLPEPIDPFWKVVVSFVIIVGDAVAVYLIVRSIIVLRTNYQRIEKAIDRLKSDFKKEIYYASFLPNLPRKGKDK